MKHAYRYITTTDGDDESVSQSSSLKPKTNKSTSLSNYQNVNTASLLFFPDTFIISAGALASFLRVLEHLLSYGGN